MKLSDIKGKLALDVAASALELVDAMAGDERFDGLLSDMAGLGGDTSGAWRVFCRHMPPILRDEKISGKLFELMALAHGTTPEDYAENGDVIGDLFGLLTTDFSTLGFLSPREETRE